jgi:hypothetical protein
MALSVNAKKGLVFGIGVTLLAIGCVIGGVWLLIVASVLDGVSTITQIIHANTRLVHISAITQQ